MSKEKIQLIFGMSHAHARRHIEQLVHLLIRRTPDLKEPLESLLVISDEEYRLFDMLMGDQLPTYEDLEKQRQSYMALARWFRSQPDAFDEEIEELLKK